MFYKIDNLLKMYNINMDKHKLNIQYYYHNNHFNMNNQDF